MSRKCHTVLRRQNSAITFSNNVTSNITSLQKPLVAQNPFIQCNNIAAFGQNKMKCLRVIGQRLIFNRGHSIFYGMAIQRNNASNISERTL